MTITHGFDEAEAYLASVKAVPDSGRSPLAKHYMEIGNAAAVLSQIMSDRTKSMRREIVGRGAAIYGIPDDI